MATAVAASRQRLTLDTASTTASLALAQGCTALLFLLAARHSQPADYGLAMSAVGIASVAASLVDFGSNTLIIRQVASGRMPEHDFAKLYVSKTWIILGLSTLYTCAVLGTGVLHHNSNARMAGLLAGTIAFSQMNLAPLRAYSRTGALATATVLDKGIAVGLGLVLLIDNRLDSGPIWLCLLVGSMTSAVVSRLLWPQTFKVALRDALRCPTQAFVNPWQRSVHFGLSAVVVGLQSLDAAIVGLGAGAHAAGEYAAVNRWTYPMGLLAFGYSQAAFPHIARASNHRQAFRRLLHGWWLLPIVLIIVIGVILNSSRLVVLLLGADYPSSDSVLRGLAIGLLPALVNQPMCMFLQARRRENWSSYALAGAIPIQLTAIWILAQHSGAQGAAYGFLIAQTLLMGVLLFLVARSGG
jgi:O-antigen/teichoic acid export membrane protein